MRRTLRSTSRGSERRAMRGSIAHSHVSWEPRSLFVCLALIVALAFQLQGLANSLGSASARPRSEWPSSARPEGKTDRQSNVEEQILRYRDESESRETHRSCLLYPEPPSPASASSLRFLRRHARNGLKSRSLPPSANWAHRSRNRVRSCVLTEELSSLENGNTR